MANADACVDRFRWPNDPIDEIVYAVGGNQVRSAAQGADRDRRRFICARRRIPPTAKQTFPVQVALADAAPIVTARLPLP
jgi:hypothetical protein